MPRRRKDAKISDDEDDALRKVSKQNHPIQRHAANERERCRMRVLSKAFSKLKTTLPWVPSDTKLSKLDTLRLASSYIAHLKQILDGSEEEIPCNPASNIHPLNLVSTKKFHTRQFLHIQSATDYCKRQCHQTLSKNMSFFRWLYKATTAEYD